MKDFRDLKVWEKSHHLTLDVYKATVGFPARGIVRADQSDAGLQRFHSGPPRGGLWQAWQQRISTLLQIAAGSASELDYHLLLSRDLGFLSSIDYGTLAEQLGELRRMLTSLILKVDLERR